MTKETIINELEKNVDALKLAYYDLLSTKQSEGKIKYGSVAEFRRVRDNVRAQIDIMNTFLQWVYINNTEPLQDYNPSIHDFPQEWSYDNDDTDIEDTPDINDMGINELSIGED